MTGEFMAAAPLVVSEPSVSEVCDAVNPSRFQKGDFCRVRKLLTLEERVCLVGWKIKEMFFHARRFALGKLLTTSGVLRQRMVWARLPWR